MKYRLTLLFLAVVVASGCIQSSGDTESSNPNLDESSNVNKIYFTGSGFQPSTITIERGESITWIDNSSSRSMWVASDQHPTHTAYDGTSLRQHCSSGNLSFDQCETGGEFRFTFNKTGTWSYHNHEPYVSGGQVKVE